MSLLQGEPISSDLDIAFSLLRERIKDNAIVSFEAEGESMFPLIETGSLALVRLTHTDALKTGDIIAYKREGRLILHRYMQKVIAKDRSYRLRTKGDNHLFFDAEAVLPEMVLGKVTSIKKWGRTIKLENGFWKINNRIILCLSYFEAVAKQSIFYAGKIIGLEKHTLLRHLTNTFISLPLVIYLNFVLLLARIVTPRGQE